jgi:pimeloyl-ACP methyl ester carboxylesterase
MKSKPIVLIPGFMGSRLLRPTDHRLFWVEPLWLPFNVAQFVSTMTLPGPSGASLMSDGVLHDVDVGDLVRIGIYRQFHMFAISPDGLMLDPADYHEFAYDWRKSIAEAAAALDALLASLPNPPITLVVHSSGGLVTAALFALGGTGSQRVGKVVALGCPFAGLLKTIDMIEQGSGMLTLLFKGDPIRQLLGGWPQAYELMPSRTDPALFLDSAGHATTPFLSAADMPTGHYQQPLLSAANTVLSRFNLKFPVPLRLIEGFGLPTTISAKLENGQIAIQRDIQGDGTCPARSLLTATGTVIDGEPGTRVFSLPFAEHVELVRDDAVLAYLRNDLCGAAPAIQITARVKIQFALPGTDNLLIIETRDSNGQPLGNGSPTAVCTDGTQIPLAPCPVAGMARWLGSFRHPIVFTSITVTVPGLAPAQQPAPIPLIP